jgi:hypothetical protein
MVEVADLLLDSANSLIELKKGIEGVVDPISEDILGFKIRPGNILATISEMDDEQRSKFFENLAYFGKYSLINPAVGIGALIGKKGKELFGDPKADAKVSVKTASDVSKYTGKIKEDTEDIFITLSHLSSNTLSSIADKFKEIRDATQEAYDFEEKKKAVLEAEQALADAYNEREVRIYNAQTGRWEMKSRQADIQKAQENLDKARLDAENSAYDEIIKDLESGNTTNEAILAIIAKWQGAYGNGDFSHVSDSVKKVLSEFGVDLTKKETGIEKIDSFEDAKFLMQKLLEPISDSDFAKNVKEKGILFGTTKTVADAVGNMIFNNQRTSQDSHNVYMNGVTIPRDVAQGHSILDIFGLFPLLGD